MDRVKMEGYLEDVSPEGGVGELQDVVGSDKVKAWLVLVHRVDNGLGGEVGQENIGRKATKPGGRVGKSCSALGGQ